MKLNEHLGHYQVRRLQKLIKYLERYGKQQKKDSNQTVLADLNNNAMANRLENVPQEF